MSKANSMIEESPQQNSLHVSLIAARLFALAVDVVRSTAGGDCYPTRLAAQQIVADRFAQLKTTLSERILLSIDKRHYEQEVV